MDLTATERPLLTLMLSMVQDLGAKRGLILQFAGIAVKVGPTSLRDWARDPPASREIMPRVLRRQHGESTVANAGDLETLSRSPELDL